MVRLGPLKSSKTLMSSKGCGQNLLLFSQCFIRISAIPAYPGLHCFPDGQNFFQWTTDDLKPLMKVFGSVFNGTFTFLLSQKFQVYLAAISGHLPLKMVQCLASFMELCFLFCWNAITTTDINWIQYELDNLHQLCEVFIEVSVWADISLPWQHALLHYVTGIMNFESPNGFCSLITISLLSRIHGNVPVIIRHLCRWCTPSIGLISWLLYSKFM